jgi:lipoprotein-anchoring transpeptidase ErfK/SrfK
MTRFYGVFLLALPVAAALSVPTAQAQSYRAAPPYYRAAPPPGVYDDGLPPPGAWMNDEDDQTPPYGARRMTQPAPQRVQSGVPGRYSQQADAVAPPPPGFASPDGRPPAYGHQLEQTPPGAGAPANDPNAIRPPGAIGAAPAATAPQAAPQQGGATSVMTLPPEDQPETGQPKELSANLKKQLVDFNTKEPAGTLIIDTPNTYLYLVLGHGKALRYGIGVGREGFTWAGTERVSKMKEWPDWFPPAEMIERQPYLPRMMAGGPGNPLGARALYLGHTLYRIHGTNQPSTIGQFVSSGCIRLLNEDIEDLFSRVQVGTRVVVMPGKQPETVANVGSVPGAGAPPPPDNPMAPPNRGTAISSRPLPPAR